MTSFAVEKIILVLIITVLLVTFICATLFRTTRKTHYSTSQTTTNIIKESKMDKDVNQPTKNKDSEEDARKLPEQNQVRPSH